MGGGCTAPCGKAGGGEGERAERSEGLYLGEAKQLGAIKPPVHRRDQAACGPSRIQTRRPRLASFYLRSAPRPPLNATGTVTAECSARPLISKHGD